MAHTRWTGLRCRWPKNSRWLDFTVLRNLTITIGDIESMPFFEALRLLQVRDSVAPSGLLNVHVSLVPVVGAVGEQKTKPAQSSVRA